MYSAFVDAADVRFPTRCIRCDAPADTLHRLSAVRGFDLLVVSMHEFLDVPVPVCAACRRRRRMAGAAAFFGPVLYVCLVGFWTVHLAFGGWTIAAWVLGISVAIVLLGMRLAADKMVEWNVLGINARWLRGPGTRLHLTFRRDNYFAEWAGLNPTATYSADAPARRAAPVVEESWQTVEFTRGLPAMCLAGILIALGLHHWYATSRGRTLLVATIVLPALGALALGGVIHPPIFWSIGKYGKHLPRATKICGAVLALAGLAVGFYLAFVFYA